MYKKTNIIPPSFSNMIECGQIQLQFFIIYHFFPFQHFHHSQHTTHKTPAVLLPIVILSLQLPSIHILPMWINKYMIFKEEIFTTSHYNRKIFRHEAQCRNFWNFFNELGGV